MNLRSECLVPDCFSDFRGGDNQSVVTNNTARYYLGFGLNSEFDSATEDLFKAYGAIFSGEKDALSYFEILSTFHDKLNKLDQEIGWEETLSYSNEILSQT